MFVETLSNLMCPRCKGELACPAEQARAGQDLLEGLVRCLGCRAQYPILAGALLLVPDVKGYLLEHVKGIARHVPETQLPKEHRGAFAKARRALAADEHIEEDLEAERVTALYMMNHYLSARDVASPDPLIAELIARHWDSGPLARIAAMLAARAPGGFRLVELGCGVGGLAVAARASLATYLGVDSSFTSVVLARHFALGAPLAHEVRLPADLLCGPVTRPFPAVTPGGAPRGSDFVVCDLADPPLRSGRWDAAAALNVIDMLPEPEALPRLQRGLLAPGGFAIQSCPYIWHPEVAAHLREIIPSGTRDSADAVEWLYRNEGFTMGTVERHVPWLFFKHERQLEVYSVHVFVAAL